MESGEQRPIESAASGAATPTPGDPTSSNGSRSCLGCAAIPVAIVVLGLGVFGFFKTLDRLDDSVGKCAKPERSDLALQQPRWRLTGPESARIVIALDDYTNHHRRGGTSVDVRKAKEAKPNQPAGLPTTVKVGAVIRGGELTDGDSSLRSVVGRAIRQRDGKTVRVRVCAVRTNRAETPPGRYTGIARVAGPSVVPTDVPVEVTIRTLRTTWFLVALAVSVLGAFAGAVNSKKPEVAEAAKEKTPYKALSVLPFITGVVAGLAAAVFIYIDDPTFGASAAADWGKLIGGTFAAATSGLTVAAFPTRAAQRRVPPTG